MKDAQKRLASAFSQAQMTINNGTTIRENFFNADDPNEMMLMMGQLKWWTLSKPTQEKPVKKKGFLSELSGILGEGLRQAKEVYNYDPEKELK